jgi:hypothetical protein
VRDIRAQPATPLRSQRAGAIPNSQRCDPKPSLAAAGVPRPLLSTLVPSRPRSRAVRSRVGGRRRWGGRTSCPLEARRRPRSRKPKPSLKNRVPGTRYGGRPRNPQPSQAAAVGAHGLPHPPAAVDPWPGLSPQPSPRARRTLAVVQVHPQSTPALQRDVPPQIKHSHTACHRHQQSGVCISHPPSLLLIFLPFLLWLNPLALCWICRPLYSHMCFLSVRWYSAEKRLGPILCAS